MNSNNIFPIHAELLTRKDREKLLNQQAKVLWLVGLSGSGKSTLANSLDRVLYQNGFKTFLLDGDNLRHGLNANLGFSEADRLENLRRAGHIAKLMLESGIVVIASFITPTSEAQEMLKEIIGDDFLLTHVNCPLEVCEKRDVKGLYAKARSGQLKNFTGIDSPFDAPKNVWLDVRTDELSIEDATHLIFDQLKDLIAYK